MTTSTAVRLVLVSSVLALSACAGGDPKLLNLNGRSDTPEEFAILPTKPLQAPADFAALPSPTPGGSNLTDPTPNADAAAALGGRGAAYAQTGIPASDAALVTRAARYGNDPGIRADLAEADLAFRRRNSALFFRRWFGSDQYTKAYRRHALDAFAEVSRLRAAGVQTPSAPSRP